jgi:hypothetical protein
MRIITEADICWVHFAVYFITRRGISNDSVGYNHITTVLPYFLSKGFSQIDQISNKKSNMIFWFIMLKRKAVSTVENDETLKSLALFVLKLFKKCSPSTKSAMIQE